MSSEEAFGDTNRSDTELAQEALENKAKEEVATAANADGKDEQVDLTHENQDDNDTEAAETEGEDDIGDGDDDADGQFTMLAKFSKEFLDVLAIPNDSLPEDERKSKPLALAQKDFKDVLRLLQVRKEMSISFIVQHFYFNDCNWWQTSNDINSFVHMK